MSEIKCAVALVVFTVAVAAFARICSCALVAALSVMLWAVYT